MALIKRNIAYSLNDIVNTKYGIKLKCTTAGTTSAYLLILDGTSPITDGTVVWEVQEEQGKDSYSTTEQEIGTWIDGKPLYRKVFTPTGSGKNYSFDTGLNNLSYNILKIYGSMHDGANTLLIPFNNAYVIYIADTGICHIDSFIDTYTVKYIVVEYTKTTD